MPGIASPFKVSRDADEDQRPPHLGKSGELALGGRVVNHHGVQKL